jgi:lipase
MAWAMWPGRGDPVVALHGITASCMSFVGVAEKLQGRVPLLALDLRGRGDTDKPAQGPFGFSQHATDVATAMGAFGLGPSTVVGHSMGAYVAVTLAAAHPELVSKLVLLDGGLPLDAPAGIPVEQILDVALAAQMSRLRATFDSVNAYFDYWKALPVFAGGLWNDWVERYLRYDHWRRLCAPISPTRSKPIACGTGWRRSRCRRCCCGRTKASSPAARPSYRTTW